MKNVISNFSLQSLGKSTMVLFLVLNTAIFAFDASYALTASDTVPSSSDIFRWGTNPGWVQGWSDQQRADLIAGNAETGIPGTGANSLRGSLPHHFIEKWGIAINHDDYEYYNNRGLDQFTLFVGGVAEEYREEVNHCDGQQSKMWKNMYAPIWDEGQNGTLVNDTNYFARYIYDVAETYGSYIKYWEIINEPDYTSSDAGWGSITDDHNWYNSNPDPCDLPNILAPISYYNRALHIAYEVIKSKDETDYVCLGGIGYVNFMDALLRNSENPVDGSITDVYSSRGGDWFDCVSFHKYPMYTLSQWENGGRTYFRHSDAAITVIDETTSAFRNQLKEYGYDGNTYPEKRLIITETNIPRVATGDLIGSDSAQYNYLSKLFIKAQTMGLDQVHTYALFDTKNSDTVTDPYSVMGFYNSLIDVPYGKQTETNAAVALRTVSLFLNGFRYDSTLTHRLKLNETIDGGAFTKEETSVVALWAKTDTDMSEKSEAEYLFPDDFNESKNAILVEWDYALTGLTHTLNLKNSVTLHGSVQLFQLLMPDSKSDPSTQTTTIPLIVNGGQSSEPQRESSSHSFAPNTDSITSPIGKLFYNKKLHYKVIGSHELIPESAVAVYTLLGVKLNDVPKARAMPVVVLYP
ncbi:MAG: hypothetical protein OCC49_13840 [Fibrobacterales bacterium]